jgi:hypothetical protein
MAIKLKPTAGVSKTTSVYDKHLASTQITAETTVTKKVAKGEEQQVSAKHEVVHPGVLIPESQLYKLTIEGSSTINLGNYESARIGISMTVPTTKEDLDASYQFATGWISTHIAAAVSEAKGHD